MPRKKSSRAKKNFTFFKKNGSSRQGKKTHLPTFSVFTIAIIIGIVLGLASLPFLHQKQLFIVKKITCSWNNGPCTPRVNAAIGVLVGKSIFNLQNETFTQHLLKNNPSLAAIDLKRALPDTVKVSFTTRDPIITIQDKNASLFLVDDQFTVFETTDTPQLTLLKINDSLALGQAIVNPIILSGISLSQALTESLLPPSNITITNNDIIEVILEQGIKVIFSTKKDLTTQVDALQYILASSKMKSTRINTVDLRFYTPIVK